MLTTNKRFFRVASRAIPFAAASLVFAACNGGGGASGSGPILPETPAQVAPQSTDAPAQTAAPLSVISVSGSNITLTGTVAYKISGGFTIQGGSGVGYLHIYTPSSTTYSGAKPYAGEYVKVVGTGSVRTSVTASSVTQISSSSTATPAPTVTSAPTTSSSTMWHIGNSYVLPSTSDGQYQKPAVSGTSADFSLIRNYNGTNNYRNQMNPTINGSLIRLTAGTTYDWKFTTVANMAPDVNYSQNLIWQIHDYNAGTSPITVLGTQNINDGHTVWYFHGPSGTWKGTYTQGATDNWEIQVKVSSGSTGTAKLWRNGVLVSSQTGANYSTSSQGYPWWNFGPYEWDWKSNHSSGQISNLTKLDFAFKSLNFGKI